MTNKCVIYVRVSSEEQVKNLSLSSQEDVCRGYAEREGWTVVDTFREPGESAKTATRTELQKLLDYCRKRRGQIHYVVVYDVSRFMRNTKEHLVLRAQLSALGIQLRCPTQPLSETSSGRLMETVFAAFAEYANNEKAERTLVGMRAAVARGRWPHLAPIGYRNARGEDGRPTLAQDPKTAPFIAHAFAQAAEGVPLQTILDQLKADGMRGARGGELTKQTLSKVLRNPLYAAVVESKAFGAVGAGAFEPIVDRETFDRARAMLFGRKRAEPHQRHNPEFPLKHFLRCGAAGCGRPLTGYFATGRHGGRYPYYQCPAGCVRGKRDVIEDAFVALVDELRPRPEFLKLIKLAVLDVFKARRTDANTRAGRLRQRAGELLAKKERLVESFVFERAIDRATYDAMLARVEEDRAGVELALADADGDAQDATEIVDYAFYVIANAGQLWRGATAEQRLALQGFLFPAGLTWSETGFVRTAVTGSVFHELTDVEAVGCSGWRPSRVPVSTPLQPRRPRFIEAAARLIAILPIAS